MICGLEVESCVWPGVPSQIDVEMEIQIAHGYLISQIK